MLVDEARLRDMRPQLFQQRVGPVELDYAALRRGGVVGIPRDFSGLLGITRDYYRVVTISWVFVSKI